METIGNPTATEPESLPFEDFEREFAWDQGEHVTLLGVNGSGKTTLAKSILPKRDYSIVFASKPRDPMVEEFERQGYYLSRDWPLKRKADRVLLWPKSERMGDVTRQREVFGRCMLDVFQQGGWCLYWDEAHFLANTLRLDTAMALIWRQGRALGLSVVAGNQRPVGMPLEAYSQATHLFFWTMNDEVDVRRAAGIAGVNRKDVAERSLSLPWHDFLYVETRHGTMIQSRVDNDSN